MEDGHESIGYARGDDNQADQIDSVCEGFVACGKDSEVEEEYCTFRESDRKPVKNQPGQEGLKT